MASAPARLPSIQRAPREPGELRLSWEQLSYKVANQTVLQPSSGTVGAGLWIMIGPSGAGKSTHLGVLAGRKAHGEIGGCVRLNGYRASPHARCEVIGYVTQDDVLPGTSTVAEHLHFHARLRLPWLSRSERALLVARTLACLQLTNRADYLIGDQFVRGLSGGERRRVSAATELLAVSAGGCGLVLMDEPLSGLDSVNATLLTNALVDLTTAEAVSRTDNRTTADCASTTQASTSAAHSVRDTPVTELSEMAPDAAPPASASSEPTALQTPKPPSPIELVGGPSSSTDLPTRRSRPGSPSSEMMPFGPTIVMTVHQPSYRLLEAVAGVVVMGPRGRMLYCGPRRLHDGQCALAAHFDGDGLSLNDISANPAEALLEAMGDVDPKVSRRIERIAQEETEAMLLNFQGRERGTMLSEQVDESMVCEPPMMSSLLTRTGIIRPLPRLLGGDDSTMDGSGGVPAWRRGSAASSLFSCGGKNGGAGCLLQMGMLCARHARQVVRHPLLLWVQLICTASISFACGAVFYQLDDHGGGHIYISLDEGVLARAGLIFFLGLYFMLTALAPLPLWSQERLLYFQERAAGCYGPVTYVLSRTLYDGLMQRILPATLCAAIVYPMAGLSHSDSNSPYHAALFIVSLCLTNLLSTAVITCIAIVCASSTVATIISVLFMLLSALFCGFIVNLPTLASQGPASASIANILAHSSYLYYWNELVLSDEMLGKTIKVDAKIDQGTTEHFWIAGEEVLAHLGYATPGISNCTRIGEGLACVQDILVPFGGVIGVFALSALLLAFCVKDPH